MGNRINRFLAWVRKGYWILVGYRICVRCIARSIRLWKRWRMWKKRRLRRWHKKRTDR